MQQIRKQKSLILMITAPIVYEESFRSCFGCLHRMNERRATLHQMVQFLCRGVSISKRLTPWPIVTCVTTTLRCVAFCGDQLSKQWCRLQFCTPCAKCGSHSHSIHTTFIQKLNAVLSAIIVPRQYNIGLNPVGRLLALLSSCGFIKTLLGAWDVREIGFYV